MICYTDVASVWKPQPIKRQFAADEFGLGNAKSNFRHIKHANHIKQNYIVVKKYVYTFGNGKAEGHAGKNKLLGGKGANLAEMNLIGIPVPAGFTITTKACTYYNKKGKRKCLSKIEDQVIKGVRHLEKIMGTTFGDPKNPLLLSVRSGARVSMPGMMDTVLNLGLNDTIVEQFAEKTGDARFAWDSYRRLVQMYGDVVMGLKAENGEVDPFESVIDEIKTREQITSDSELTVDHLKELVSRFKLKIEQRTGRTFPTDPWVQLWGFDFCRVRKLEQRTRRRIPKTQRHPIILGNGCQCTGHGLWQSGRNQCNGGGFYPGCRNRRRPVQWRISRQCTGRRCRCRDTDTTGPFYRRFKAVGQTHRGDRRGSCGKLSIARRDHAGSL